MTGRIYSPRRHEGTKNTKRKEIAALQDFGDHSVTLGMHSSWSIARKDEKIIGMRVQFGLALIAGGNHSCRTLPSLFLLRALRGLRGETVGCGQRLLQMNSCPFVVHFPAKMKKNPRFWARASALDWS